MGNSTSSQSSGQSPSQIAADVVEMLQCISNSSLLYHHTRVPPTDLDRHVVTRSTFNYSSARFYSYIWTGVVAAFLLLFCALLAGLTLALCGLDDTLIQLRTATGTDKERRQAAAVAKLKRHGTWMLCALIICSVAAGETFPFLMQWLFTGRPLFLAIIVSTLLLALIAEILPQYIIPRNAIAWGYYCLPIIWACMITTSPLSWPIAWLLDAIFGKGREEKLGIFTNDQLQEIIRHHDRSESHGGQLGEDAARVAIGALKLDSRTLGADLMRVVPPVPEGEDMDIEKAPIIVSHGLIVKWSLVKTIKIDDFVDQPFMKKVKGWSYSRIPVISKAEIGPWVGDERNLQGGLEDWDGTRIYGFLHTRNLVGLELKPGLKVKDLLLYPLPIVRESMSVYELLNMFQLGMSRMAIVVANPKQHYLRKTEFTPSVFHDPADFSTMQWTATKRTNENNVSMLRVKKNENVKSGSESSPAKSTTKDNGQQQNIYGIRSPKPVGIVTFEDIVDIILQKTSRDEKDFFDRAITTTPIKATKTSDSIARGGARDLSPIANLPPITVQKSRNTPKTSSRTSTLRFRASSKNHEAISNLDGAAESKEGKSTDRKPGKKSSERQVRSESSYTDDSNGGFHGSFGSSSSAQGWRLTAADIINLNISSPYDYPNSMSMQVKSNSLPSRGKGSKSSPISAKDLWRNASASPALPPARSTTPGESRLKTVTFDDILDVEKGKPELIMPMPSMESAARQLRSSTDGETIFTSQNQPQVANKRGNDESAETIMSLSSWCGTYYEHDSRFDADTAYDALPFTLQRMHSARDLETITEERSTCDLGENSSRPYAGFPAELLDRGEENRVPNYASFTLPRLPDVRRDFTPVRERSYEDDRGLLPSERKALQPEVNAELVAMRSSSLWF